MGWLRVFSGRWVIGGVRKFSCFFRFGIRIRIRRRERKRVGRLNSVVNIEERRENREMG